MLQSFKLFANCIHLSILSEEKYFWKCTTEPKISHKPALAQQKFKKNHMLKYFKYKTVNLQSNARYNFKLWKYVLFLVFFYWEASLSTLLSETDLIVLIILIITNTEQSYQMIFFSIIM